MGKKDTITKEYMRNPIVFADAFNKYLYHGRQVIKPEELKELDTTEITVPYGSDGAGVPEQRYRDVLKTVMTDGNMAYCILGIENQSDIHYAVPVKNGLYDFMQLAHQVAETAKSHKQEEKLYIKYSKDKRKLQEVTQKDKNFRNLERQAAEVISVTTNSELKYPEGQEVVDVCAAIEEMKMDSRIEGKIEGEIKGSVETYQEVGFSLQDTIQRVAEKFSLSLKKAEEEARKYWK